MNTLRWPVESMLRDCHEYGKLIRVNISDPKTPADLCGISFTTGAVDFMHKFSKAAENPKEIQDVEKISLEKQMKDGLVDEPMRHLHWLKMLEQLRD